MAQRGNKWSQFAAGGSYVDRDDDLVPASLVDRDWEPRPRNMPASAAELAERGYDPDTWVIN
ncbi:MAG TPA: hypothetical protein DD808_14335, partial [Halieaceae bacterium]|nr:hypothetical protein [Halieaceae bacterium]